MGKPLSLFTAALIIAASDSAVAQDRGPAQAGRADSSAFDRSMTFADIYWGTPRDSVRVLLPPKGYEYVKANRFGDDVYLGVAGKTVVQVWTFFASGRLAKVLLVVETSIEDARSAYDVLVATAKEKHGAPTGTIERFDPPYRKGDGFEMQALHLDKALIATLWQTPGAPKGTAGMSVRMERDMTVSVTYESTRWRDEARRRSGGR